MKLVEILARELKEWPEGASHIVSALDGGIHQTIGGAPGNDQNDDVLPFTVLSGCGDEVFWNNRSVFWLSVTPDDYKTAIVTREMWQAAKYKLEGKMKAPKANKDGRKRHRGGKCPVEAGTLIDVRYRDGQVNIGVGACDGSKGSASRSAVYWRHDGDSANIMAYRLHKPGLVTDKESLTVEQANERAFDACVEKCAADDIEKPEQIDGSLQWRDRIHAIDSEQKSADEAHKAATDARTAERAELVQKLAGERLAADDMSDPRNWKRGDVVECLSDYNNQFTRGKFYTLRSDYREKEYSVKIFKDDTGDTFNGWSPENFKWHSRPTA